MFNINKKFLVVIFLLSISIVSACSQKTHKIGQLGSQHIHLDIKVYVDGAFVDFSQPQYQLRAKFVHFEDGRGDVVHVHATGVTVADILDTLKIKFDQKCLTLNNGVKYCSDNVKTLNFFVNDLKNEDYGNYVVKNLDRILISYGSENQDQIKKQLDSVTSNSAIYSGGK